MLLSDYHNRKDLQKTCLQTFSSGLLLNDDDEDKSTNPNEAKSKINQVDGSSFYDVPHL